MNDFLPLNMNRSFQVGMDSFNEYDNSFVIDQDINSVKIINEDIKTQKKTPKQNNKIINRTINSFKSLNN